MGRRRATVTGSTVPDVATAPATLPVTSIAHNPRNPREDYSDVDELADSIRTTGVLQPLGVVRYEIFLTHYPEHEHEVGAHDWIVINGNRRLAAARLAEVVEVPVRALDHLGRDGMLDEAVLVENIHRAALSPVREAEALRLLVERHGSQNAVATRIGKTKGFVSQRLALLTLTPDLQHALHEGALPLEEARSLGRLPAAEQGIEWERRQAAAHERPRPEPVSVYGVNAGPASPPHPPEHDEAVPVEERGVAEQTTGQEVQHQSPGAAPLPGVEREPARPRQTTAVATRIPLGTPAEIAAHLRAHLTIGQMRELGQLLLS